MNKQSLNLEEIFPLIAEVIASGGEFRLYPKGVSMLPLIKQGSDSVVLVSLGDVAVNDMVLYRRDDGAFVLHRVVKIKGDEYVMCGDNQYELEYGIKSKHLLAKVAYLYDGDRRVTFDTDEYKSYVASLPKKRRRMKLKARLVKIKNAIFPRKKGE